MARSPASGVRRSCDTQATSSRRLASAWRSRSRASASHMLARASRRPAHSPAARLTTPAVVTKTTSTCRSWLLMNMPTAELTMPASTARTVMTTSTTMCNVTERPRSGLPSRNSPSPATMSDVPSAMDSVIRTSCIFVPVADAPHGQDPPRLGGVVLDLLPQPSHVDGHGRLVAERPAPDVLEQLGPAEHPARVAHEEDEQVELAYGERHLVLAEPDDPPRDVHREVAVDQRLGRSRRRWCGSAQDRADAQYKFPG